MKRNLILSMFISLIFALLGVALWGAISYFTNFRLGVVGILIGFLVGGALSKSNVRTNPMNGILAVIITAGAIVLGEFLSIILVVMKEYGLTFMETLPSLDYKVAMQLVLESSGPKSFIIYAFSIFEAFKFGASAGAIKAGSREEADLDGLDAAEDII